MNKLLIGTINLISISGLLRTILLCIMLFRFSQMLYSQDSIKNMVGGNLSFDYEHVNHPDWGMGNEYSWELNILYGRLHSKYFLPILRKSEVLINKLSSNPYITGIKLDFSPTLTFSKVFVRKYYNIRCNPFFRIYSKYNIFLEAGIGLNIEWWIIYEPNPQNNSYYIPKATTISYFLDGGLGYKIKVKNNITIEPVILYRYLDDIKFMEKYGITNAKNKNAGFYPYVSLQYYF